MRAGYNWLILGIVGVVLVVAVVLFNFFLVPWAIHYQVGNTLALKNGSDALKRWVDTPVDIYLKIYIFNVENPKEVRMGGKPRVKEQGPYVYRERRHKEMISVHTDRDTIEYNQTLTFTFDQNKSGILTENDQITVLNPMMIGMMQIVEAMPLVEKLEAVLDFGLPQVLGPAHYNPFIQTTVAEFLFEGFTVYCNQSSPNAATMLLCSSFNRFMPLKMLFRTDDGMDNYKMAILKYKNHTAEGPFEVNRGIDNIDDLGKITKWKGSEITEAWSGQPCNKIRGSDTSLLPPFVTHDSELFLFSTDICSSVALQYMEDIEYEGISGYRFAPTKSFLGSVTDYKENYCYCPGTIKGLTRPGGCLKEGALDVSSCLQVPGLVTFPHFWKASPDYSTLIDGLHPDPMKHNTYIDLEPTTGTPLRGYQRVQVNLLAKPVLSLRLIQHISTSVFPLLWMEEGFELGDDMLQLLRDQLLKVMKIIEIIKWVLIACGIVMALVGFIMAFIKLRRK